MARPRKSKAAARSEQINLRLTPAEHLAIAQQAQRLSLSITDYARAVLTETTAMLWKRARGELVRRHGKPTKTGAIREAAKESKAIAALRAASPAARSNRFVAPRTLDAATFTELRRQGVNLNQIAKQMNTLQLPPPRELVELLARIRAIITAHIPAGP